MDSLKLNELVLVPRCTLNIKTLSDVKKFLTHLRDDIKLNFHPDDDFNSYINVESNEPIFDSDIAAHYNQSLDQCFIVCDENEACIHGIGLDIFYPHLIKKTA